MRHQPTGSLHVAVALGACAGFVDAHVYLHVTPVFVANMSGNLVHLGMYLGQRGWSGALASAVALCGFAVAVVLATVHHDMLLRAGRHVRSDRLIAIEAALVLTLSLLISKLHVQFTTRPIPRDLPVLLVGGLAMGLQAASLRRVGEISVSTTYATGSVVRVGEKVALGLRRADRATEARRRVTIIVLLVVMASYVLGAVAAAAAGADPMLLVLPAGLLAGAALLVYRWPTDLPGDM